MFNSLNIHLNSFTNNQLKLFIIIKYCIKKNTAEEEKKKPIMFSIKFSCILMKAVDSLYGSEPLASTPSLNSEASFIKLEIKAMICKLFAGAFTKERCCSGTSNSDKYSYLMKAPEIVYLSIHGDS